MITAEKKIQLEDLLNEYGITKENVVENYEKTMQFMKKHAPFAGTYVDGLPAVDEYCGTPSSGPPGCTAFHQCDGCNDSSGPLD
jgi:hypothetical protein